MRKFAQFISSMLFVFWVCIPVAKAQDVAVTEANSDSAVRLGLNRTLTVRLAQTGGTGYRWVLGKTADSRILALASTINDGKGEEKFGGRTRQVFRYTGRSVGTTELTLSLTRSSGQEIDEAETFRLTVEVVGGSDSTGSGVTLRDSDNGRRVQFHAGDTISIRLAVTAGTGYRWTPDRVPIALLRAVGQPQIEKPKSGRLGVDTMQVFRYQVLREGEGQLRFAYRRGVQKGAKTLRTWQVNFTTLR